MAKPSAITPHLHICYVSITLHDARPVFGRAYRNCDRDHPGRQEGKFSMRIKMMAGVAAACLALSACGGSGDDALGDKASENAENKADAIEEVADNATGAQEDALDAQADATRASGEAKEEAIDDADVDAGAMTNAQKNEITKAE